MGILDYTDARIKALEAENASLQAELADRQRMASSLLSTSIKNERADCMRAFDALVSVKAITPAEGYACNSSWAISDLCRVVRQLAAELEACRDRSARIDIVLVDRLAAYRAKVQSWIEAYPEDMFIPLPPAAT